MPAGRAWFRMHAAAVTGGIAVVSHADLTSRPDAGSRVQGPDESP